MYLLKNLLKKIKIFLVYYCLYYLRCYIYIIKQSEINNKTMENQIILTESESIWNQGMFSDLEKKPFFRVDKLRKNDSERFGFNMPFSIFLVGHDFNGQVYDLLKSGTFGKYEKKHFLTIDSDSEELEEYKDDKGQLHMNNIPSKYKSYMYYVEKVDFLISNSQKINYSVNGKNREVFECNL